MLTILFYNPILFTIVLVCRAYMSWMWPGGLSPIVLMFKAYVAWRAITIVLMMLSEHTSPATSGMQQRI